MNIEKLLGMSGDEIEKISDEELKKYLAPYLVITRPDPSKMKDNKKIKVSSTGQKIGSSKLDKAASILAQLNLKVEDIL